jgi:hypothetical protein
MYRMSQSSSPAVLTSSQFVRLLESLENVVDLDGLDLDFFAEPLHLVPLESNTYLVDPFVHDNHVTDSQLVQAAEDVDPPASIIQQLELPFDGKFYDCDEELLIIIAMK